MKKNSITMLILTVQLCSTIITCTKDDSATTVHRYLWANYNQFSGNRDSADNWYKKLFSSHSSPYTYKGYINFLADNKQFQQITELISSLNKKFSHDPEIQLIFAHALEKTDRVEEADSLIITLSQSFKAHSEIALRATQIYIKRKEFENALLTINAFLNNAPPKPNNFVFYLCKTQIYIQLNQLTHALDSIQQCLDCHPQFDKGWLLCASLNEQAGKIQEAIAGYATFLELSHGNSSVEQHLANLILRYKNSATNKHVFRSHTPSIDNALVLFKQHRYDQALAHINQCIERNHADNECKLFKIQICSTMKNFSHAAQSLITWACEQPESHLWPQALYLLAHAGMQRSAIIDAFTSIITFQPKNVWAHLYCADMLIRDKQYPHALTHLEQSLACTMHNELRAQTLYQMALLHYEQNNYPEMLANLEKSHNYHQNFAHTTNALAYYWATKGNNLPKAHHFIEKALAIDSINPYFLDTHAVIYYKEKKYAQALQILENLANPTDGTILVHLAQVHYKLNNKEKADIFIKKAQTVAKNSYEKHKINKIQILLASHE